MKLQQTTYKNYIKDYLNIKHIPLFFYLGLALFSVAFGFSQTSSKTAPITIPDRTISVWGGMLSWKERGVKIKSSFVGKGKVTVTMRSTNTEPLNYTCIFPAGTDNFPKEYILYQTTVDEQNKGTLDKGTAETGTVYNTKIFVPFVDGSGCKQNLTFGSSIKTNEEIYYKRNIRTYHYAKRGWFLFHRFSLYREPVKITLEFTDDLTIDDIELIKLPGLTLTGKILATHPVSVGTTSGLNISSVSFVEDNEIIPLTVNGRYYDGTYRDMWLNNKPIPSYDDFLAIGRRPQRPYRIPLKRYSSHDDSGYVNHTGDDSENITVYLRNSTFPENHKFKILLDVNFSFFTFPKAYTYRTWLNYNQEPNAEGLQSYDEFIIDKPDTLEETRIYETITEGEGYVRLNNDNPPEINIPVPSNSSTLELDENGVANRRLRISIKKTSDPLDFPEVDESNFTGEVEDFTVQFKKSICEDGTEIPYDYLVYAQKELDYCEYKTIKQVLDDDYIKDPTTGFFETGVKKNILYGMAKMSKTAYASKGSYLLDLAIPFGYPPLRVEYLDNNGDLNPVLDYKSKSIETIMFPSKLDEEVYPNRLANRFLYTDVYYPLPKSGKSMADLSKLPLLIFMAGGAFMWNNRQKPTDAPNMAKWFASRGYVVAVMDYRLGAYMNGKIMPRPIIRAWQDSRTVLRWWLSSGYHEYHDDDSPLWRVDLDKVYGAGHSAGAITMLQHATLTNEQLDDEINNGFLSGIGKYEVPKGKYREDVFDLDPEGLSESIFTYDIRDFPSLPCISTSVGTTTCDWFDTRTNIDPNTNKPFWGRPLSNLTLAETQEFNNIMNLYTSKDPRFKKVIALSGSLLKVNYINNPDNVPILAIHHEDDGIIAADTEYPFVGVLGIILKYGIAPYFDLTVGAGTRSIAAAYKPSSNNIFKYLIIDGSDKGGGAKSQKHAPFFKFGGPNYKEFIDKYDVFADSPIDIHEIEEKVMLYQDAFLTKNYCDGTCPNPDASGRSPQSNVKAVKEQVIASTEKQVEIIYNAKDIKNEFELKSVFDGDFVVFPNPAKDELHIQINIQQEGPLYLELLDLQGRQVYEMTENRISEGYRTLTLQNMNIPAGAYVLRVKTAIREERELIVLE